MRVLLLTPLRRGAQPSGGDLYDALMAEGLKRLGHGVELRSSLPRRVTADVVLEDSLDFERFTAFNEALERAGHPARRVALVHVTTARLSPKAQSAAREARHLDSSHAAVFVSRQARAESLRLLGARPLPTVVVPPGADRLPAAPRRARRRGPLRLLCVGHLSPLKGQRALLEAFAACRKLDATLVLAGDGGVDPGYTRALERRLREVPRARWVGPLGRRAVARALASADVFVSASAYESWGMAAAEARAAGLPVVSWSRGGLWEWLEPGVDSLRARAPGPAALEPLRDARRVAALQAGARRAPVRRWADAAAELATFLERLVQA